MKIVNKLRLVKRSMAQRVFVTILMICMCITSFYMIDVVMTNYLTDAYIIEKISSMFGVSPDCVGCVSFLNYDKCDIKHSDKLKDYLENNERVAAVGYYTENQTQQLCEDGISFVIIEAPLIDMGNLKLTKEDKAKLQKGEGDYDLALLGSKYKDRVKMDDTFSLNMSGDNTCKVAGFLKEGASYPKRLGLFMGASGSDAYTLDEKGIVVTNDFSRYNNYRGAAMDIYYISKRGGDKQLEGDIKRYAKEMGVSVRITNQGEDIKEQIENNHITGDKTFVAAMLLLVLSVITISVTSAVYCLVNKRNYGVMMVSGMQRKEIGWIIVAQNFIIVVLSAIVAWIARQYELFGSLLAGMGAEDVEFLYIPQYVSHHIYIPIIMICVAVVIILCSSIMPVLFIKRMSLVGLVNGK